MTPNFVHDWYFLIKSQWYEIKEDPETGDAYWYDQEWNPVHLIIKKSDRDRPWKMPIIIWNASDKAVRMVQEVNAHNDELKKKKAKENTEATKKYLHEWIKKIKSQGIL